MAYNRPLWRWAIPGVIVVALLNLPGPVADTVKSAFRETARPLQRALDSASGQGRAFFYAIGRIPRLLEENEALARETARLHVELEHVRARADENLNLRRLLAFDPPPATTWIAAEVLARSQDGWWQTIRLNKGSAHGITTDQAVMSMEGLVGRTISVSRNTADVLLLSDPAFRVSARLARTGSFGIINGRGPSWRGQVFCRMDFIHKDEAVQPGDAVVSSGLGGVFPANIPIGYVDRVVTDASGLYQQADIITRADLSALRYVFVVQQTAGATVTPGAAL